MSTFLCFFSMTSEFHTQVVEMTPEWASELLKGNTNNRGLSKTKVKSFAKQIQQGKWRKTGQGISVAHNGRLLDGQTRLHAVVQSGMHVPMVIAWNCDESSFAVFDTGRARSATDVLKIAGCQQHQSTISAGLRLAIPLIEEPTKYFAISQGITNEQILDLWKSTVEQSEWCANLASSVYSQFKIISKSLYFTFLYLARHNGWDESVLTEFSGLLASGVDLERGSPILAYRQFLTNGVVRCNMNQQRLMVIACIIKCFNQYVEGISTTKFTEPKIPPMIEINSPPSAV